MAANNFLLKHHFLKIENQHEVVLSDEYSDWLPKQKHKL